MKVLSTNAILIVAVLGSIQVNGGLAKHQYTAAATTTTTTSPFGVVVRPHQLRNYHQHEVVTTVASSTVTTTTTPISTTVSLRGGGGCNDSDSALFLKVGVSAIVESVLLWTVLLSSIVLSNRFQSSIPKIFGLPLLELVASFLVIFCSSFFGSVTDNTLSAATKQVLAPNVVPGDDPNWYNKLVKPKWTPPGYVFPIMWLIISKPTQLCAVSRILKFGGTDISTFGSTTGSSSSMIETIVSAFRTLSPLLVYCSHLAMGDAWNKVFFGLQCPGRGLAVIGTFYGLLLTSAYIFYTLDEVAGYYMIPTCIWVTIATALNYSIYMNNKPQPTKGNSKKRSNTKIIHKKSNQMKKTKK
jgi:benzodiazapine receptor